MAHGVSLTRDRHFATAWGQVVLVLDQRSVAQVHKIKPVLFHNAQVRREAEEFVIGPIGNLRRYLVAIEVSKRARQDMEQTGGYDALLNPSLPPVSEKLPRR